MSKALLIPLCAVMLVGGDAPLAPRRIPDHGHAFDFWIGSWQLTFGDSGTATNTITREMDGHAIVEHFEQASQNYRGQSWSVYDSTNDRWQQTWVDNQGGYFALLGGWKDDRMILETAPVQSGGPRFYRMIFRDITHDRFEWDWMLTEDGGATWQLKWHIRYERTP